MLPLKLGDLDHYTSIVYNAKQASQFHENILGFKLIDIKEINTSPESRNSNDAINYILNLPNEEKKTCVITQSLESGSIFDKLLQKYGEGIHHVAYQCVNIEETFNKLIEQKIPLASNQIMRDPINGLYQLFIDRSCAGYFIEIIQRCSIEQDQEVFTEKNMVGLANTMKHYCD